MIKVLPDPIKPPEEKKPKRSLREQCDEAIAEIDEALKKENE